MFVRTRYQYGSLRPRKRERGPDVWEFRYYETDAQGQRKRQSVILRDRNLYATETQARKATFLHTYRSWLDETGAPMKVQKELMRHTSIQTTMNVYGRAMTETKRRANSQVAGLVFGPNPQDLSAKEAAAVA